MALRGRGEGEVCENQPDGLGKVCGVILRMENGSARASLNGRIQPSEGMTFRRGYSRISIRGDVISLFMNGPKNKKRRWIEK
jgi:hypothetical protein